ncbi:MAG: cell division protein ZapA [Eubacterium sp.]|nr:cell division protein ZapA [Eubacterium sp.]
MSKVNVKIYNQDYTIAGDCNEETIEKIANHVDEQMKMIARAGLDSSSGSVAVLAAVNITEELMLLRDEVVRLKGDNEKIKADMKYYMEMWEKSKKNSQSNKENVSELQGRIRDDAARMKELRDKCSEYENSFFDLQMENIKLKNELDKLKAKL